jgi:ribokinase
MQTVTEAAQVAHAAGTTVVLNAAPQAPLDVGLCDSIDLLLVNEGEARALAGDSPSGRPGDGRGGTADAVDRDVDRLLERVPAVLVTLGPRGALYGDRAGVRHREPGRQVTVVDTTAAGDTFAGYLAAALAEGIPVPAALARANAAAALAVGRRGAVDAVPRRADIDARAAD